MKATFFPLGDTHNISKDYGKRCLWRELSLMLHLICKSLYPKTDLMSYIENWDSISKELQEAPRKRIRQVQAFSLS